MNRTPITIAGNLTRDPELRYTPNGVAVARISVAVNDRRYDSATNTWVDEEPTFWACDLWRALAENTAATLTKGMRVVVTGTLRMARWTGPAPENTPRERLMIDVKDVGPSLLWATADVIKATKTDMPPDDPWAMATGVRPASTAPVDEWGTPITTNTAQTNGWEPTYPTNAAQESGPWSGVGVGATAINDAITAADNPTTESANTPAAEAKPATAPAKPTTEAPAGKAGAATKPPAKKTTRATAAKKTPAAADQNDNPPF